MWEGGIPAAMALRTFFEGGGSSSFGVGEREMRGSRSKGGGGNGGWVRVNLRVERESHFCKRGGG